jgi:hypothetical protein
VKPFGSAGSQVAATLTASSLESMSQTRSG